MLSQKRPLSPSGEPSEHTSKKLAHVTRSSTTDSPPTKSLTGIIVRTIQRSEDFQAMATELVKSDDLSMDTSKSTIGNPEGFALLSQMDSLGNQVKDLQNRMERSEERMEISEGILDSVLVLRHGILDEWAGQPRDLDEVQERNGVAHGGSILVDIRAILSMFQDEPERAEGWKEAFLSYYGVSWPEVTSPSTLLKAGSRIVKIFNIHANSKCLNRYQKECNTQRKAQVMTLCEQWITKWKSDHTLEIPFPVFEKIRAMDRNVY